MLKTAWEDIERLIKEEVQPFTQKLKEAAQDRPNEATFRERVSLLIEDFCRKVDIQFIPKEEYSLARGRADTVFNRLILEYKRPGYLRDSNEYGPNRKAIEQIKGYMEDIARKERHDVKRLAGVILDGNYFIFVRKFEKTWREEKPSSVNVHSVEKFLRQLVSLSSSVAMTSENLINDFGTEHLRTQRIIRALVKALNSSSIPLVQKLFEQWKTFFSEVIEYREAFRETKLKDLRKFARKVGIDLKRPEEAEPFFFAMHTYFALLVKLIAWLAVSRYTGVKLGFPDFGRLATLPSEELKREMFRLEQGGIFREYGIRNLLEGDFFSWYLHTWDKNIDEALRDLLSRLAEYDPTTLEVDPDETRDLLKKLYHYLMPREIRHNLGEYYTPDWLAQRLLNQIDSRFFTEDPEKSPYIKQNLLKLRFLDPACGSGTFLVLIIKRIKEAAKELFIPEEEVLRAILNNVVGIDLNPLAVIAARTNYLLALGELLQYWKGEYDIPVYLADSVVTPSERKFFTSGIYLLPTSVGEFEIPKEVVDRERIDKLSNLLEECVKGGISSEVFLERAKAVLALKDAEFERAKPVLKNLFEKLAEFEKQKLNGIWARIIKNGFAPMFIGKFDYVVGNPPWVNWESLPDGYRDRSKNIWLKYGLLAKKGKNKEQFELGKKKLDFSMLMTYTSLDYFLKLKGKLGFLITQSVFKVGAGETFRRFVLPDGTPMKVVHVDDMVELKPFEGASNRTSVVIFQKGSPTTYPIFYTYWKKIVKGKSINFESSLDEVMEITERKNFYAEPVNPKNLTSPWITGRSKVLKAVRKILGKSDYEAHEGVNTGGANAVYWVNIELKKPDGMVLVTNITEGAKRKVEEVSAVLEPDLLYPLLRGRDVKRWYAEPSAWIIVPHSSESGWKAISEKEMAISFPKTYAYFKQFKDLLLNRAAYQLLRKGHPFYIMKDISTYTFAPYKVVWRYIAENFTCAVTWPVFDSFLGLKEVIHDHRLIAISSNSKQEAHYICALLNSSPSCFLINSYKVETQTSTHVLEYVNIPKFNSQNEIHLKLSELSEIAHKLAREGKEKELKKVEEEIDFWAAKLWGLTDEELEDIKLSLQELIGDKN